MPDPNWWNAAPGELRSDWQRARLEQGDPADRPLDQLDICPICQVIVERVYVPVMIDAYTVLICCGDTCADELRSRRRESER
mgnify:FL=1